MATIIPSTDVQIPTASETCGLDQLCFTTRQADGRIDLWAPSKVEGGWVDECRVGRAFARQAVSYVRETGDAPLLSGIVRTLVERGIFGGVEVGFFTAVANQLAAE